MNPIRRIALFGGSFDPVHLGHLEIARRAIDALSLDQVRFLPCRQSPHKAASPRAADHHRLAMLRLATSDLPGVVVDDLELQAPPPSYSIDTAREIRRIFPAARLFWIVGRDQWDALPRWHQAENLAGMLEFIVFSREGTPAPRPGWVLHPVAGTHPASSTAIRQALANGRPPPPWLPPPVLDYIGMHGLYS